MINVAANMLRPSSREEFRRSVNTCSPAAGHFRITMSRKRSILCSPATASPPAAKFSVTNQTGETIMRRVEDDDFNPDGTLKDGHSMRVPMTMMDSLQRSIANEANEHFARIRQHDARDRPLVTDGNGGTAGLHRPGYRFAADDPVRVTQDYMKREAVAEYDNFIRDSWRDPDDSNSAKARARPRVPCAPCVMPNIPMTHMPPMTEKSANDGRGQADEHARNAHCLSP
jgi:hypothetical protein